jgi:hypothetical protein
MATIEAGGINAQSAPSPIQLATWQDDWGPQLPGLTAWVATTPAPVTAYRCTTTATVAATETVVDDDLTAWVDADSGHRHYSVT